MPSLSQVRMLGLDDLIWPVSYRFLTSSSDGFSSTTFTVDLWPFNGMIDNTKAIAPLLWKSTVATATCSSLRLELCEVQIWKEPSAPVVVAPGDNRGILPVMPAARDRSLVMGLHTGHGDRWGTRRHYLHGIPRGWNTNKLLNSEGWDGAMRYAHVLCMGLQNAFIGGGWQHLLHYTDVVPFDISNIWGVAFRRVTSYSVCEQVDDAPLYSPGAFPENPL